MKTSTYPIVIKQGADFDLTFFFYLVDPERPDKRQKADLSGYTGVRSQVRKSPGAETVLMTFDTALNVADASVTLSFPKSETKNLTFLTGQYDVFLDKANGGADKAVMGPVTVEMRGYPMTEFVVAIPFVPALTAEISVLQGAPGGKGDQGDPGELGDPGDIAQYFLDQFSANNTLPQINLLTE